MLRLVFAGFLALHGLVHVLGFLVPWQVMTSPDFPYTTTAAWGAVELGDTGARIVGLGMLTLAGGYLVAAFGVARRVPWAIGAVALVTAASVVLTVLQSPAAVLGLVINVGILLALVLDQAAGDPLHLRSRTVNAR